MTGCRFYARKFLQCYTGSKSCERLNLYVKKKNGMHHNLSNLIRRIQQSTISDFSLHAVGGHDTLAIQTWLHLLIWKKTCKKAIDKKRIRDSKPEGVRWEGEKEKWRGRVYFRACVSWAGAESVWGQFEYLIWVIHRNDSQTTPVLINTHREGERGGTSWCLLTSFAVPGDYYVRFVFLVCSFRLIEWLN